MRDLTNAAVLTTAPTFELGSELRLPAQAVRPEMTTTDLAPNEIEPLTSPALAKRARPTSSFEGFGSFSG